MNGTDNNEDGDITIRAATASDGAGMWRVVEESKVLDLNSSYLYLLMGKHFHDTCVVAEHGGEIVGLVTGYRPPEQPDALFLWQVGVHPRMQGHGLGKKLVAGFLRTPGAAGARMLHTTVTPSNEPSRALFRAVARDLGAECRIGPFFTADMFPGEGHEEEELFEIGPLTPEAIATFVRKTNG